MTKKEESLIAEFYDPESWDGLVDVPFLGWEIQKLKGSNVHRIYVPKRIYWEGFGGVAESSESGKTLLVFTIDITKEGHQKLYQYGDSKNEILSIMRGRHLEETK